MYATPTLTDLGSFQALTLGGGVHAASGGIIGPVGSLVNGTAHQVNHVVHGVIGQLPGVGVGDNSHVGTDNITIDPKVTITPR